MSTFKGVLQSQSKAAEPGCRPDRRESLSPKQRPQGNLSLLWLRQRERERTMKLAARGGFGGVTPALRDVLAAREETSRSATTMGSVLRTILRTLLKSD